MDTVTAAKRRKNVPKPSSLQGMTEYTLFAKQIDNSKVTDLAGVLKTNTSLTFLGFRGWVGDAGAKVIAASLADNRTLETLSFDSTRVGYQGVVALAKAISVKCSLTHLSLMYCPLQDNAVLVLCHALAEPICHLRVLRLDCCPQITNSSGELLLNTLLNNRRSKMHTVGLRDTGVDLDIQRSIRLLLAPGGRTLEKKQNPSCDAAAYLSSNLGINKSELKTLHGFVENIGPLCSATAVRVKPLPPPKETATGVNSYKKYAYRKNNNRDKKTAAAEEEMEEAIDFAHAKKTLLPILSSEQQKRKQGATLSNIKMLLKFNATLAKKIGN
jgi:hypothetical protein